MTYSTPDYMYSYWTVNMVPQTKHDETKETNERNGNTMKRQMHDISIFFLRKDNSLARLLAPSTAPTKVIQSPCVISQSNSNSKLEPCNKSRQRTSTHKNSPRPRRSNHADEKREETVKMIVTPASAMNDPSFS
jgi:hypothetical protein